VPRESSAPSKNGLSSYSQHLYAFIVIVLLMTVASSYWPGGRVRDCRPAVLPPPLKSSEVYPAPVSVTP
jgi:hypothetical protein